MMKNLILIILTVFIYGSVGYAQKLTDEPKSITETLRFYLIDDEEGLSNNTVNSIAQDSLGFIWIGTIDGLNRYDGNTFVKYQPVPGIPSLLNNYVQHVMVDKQGKIWISSNGGLNSFDVENESFSSFTTENGLLLNNVNSSIPGPGCTKIIGIYRGGIQLLHPDGSLRNLLNNTTPANSLSSNEISSLAMQGDSVVWAGTFNGGLNKIRFKDRKVSRITFRPKQYSPTINHVYTDRKGNVWIGSLAGLHVITTTSDTIFVTSSPRAKTGLSDADVLCMHEDEMGRMWIGTRNGGLNIINTREFLEKKGNVPFYWFLPREDGESVFNRTVSAIMKDKDGNMWLGTSTGINFVNPRGENLILLKRKPMSRETLAHSRVSSLEKENNGKVWIGTDGGGLNLFDPFTGKFQLYKHKPNDPFSLSNDYILSLKKDSHGRLWVGTYRGGINRMDPATGKCRYYLQGSVSQGSDVRSIFEDNQNRIWVGTNQGGLYRYDEQTDTFASIKKTGSLDIRDILQDKSGGLWLATYGNGICYYHPEKDSIRYINDSNTPGFPGNTVFSLTQTGENEIWAGVRYGGLVKLNIDTEQLTVFSEKDGLSNSTVNSLIQEDRENLWLGTMNGISHFHIPTGRVTNLAFPESNNLGELNNNAVTKASNGYLFFGGNKGLAIFHPNKIKEDKPSPPLVLTGLKLFNKKVAVNPHDKKAILKQAPSHQKEIILSYDQSLFSIDFAALTFPFSKKVFYSYMLEGYNDHWIESGNVGTANFSNLPPGTYNLKVRATMTPGSGNESFSNLAITITPPFWKTLPAYILYGLLLALLIYGALKYYSERVKLQNSLVFEKKQRQLEHDINEERLRFFTSFSHELKTPLTLILAPVEDLLLKESKYKKSLGLVQKNARYLLQIINKLLEFRKTEVGLNDLKIAEYRLNALLENWVNNYQHLAQRRKITLTYKAPAEDVVVWLDLEKVQIMVYNLLSNAFKFTPLHGTVEVSLLRLESYVHIQVKDSGTGISPAALPHIFNWYYKAGDSKSKGTGIGLALSKRLAELHQGDIQVESRLNAGTTFTISLPLDQELSNNLQQPTSSNISGTSFEHQVPNLPDFEFFSETEDCEEKIIHTNSEESKEVLLLIDDNPGIIQYLTGLLKNDYHIINAHDGQQGLQKAHKYIPDLIISDISMPGKNGLELCRSLKQHAATTHIPVILLTVNDTLESIKEGFEEGADLYLTKPFNGQLLLTQVKSLLDKRKKLRAYFNASNTENLPMEEEENSSLFLREKGFLEELEKTILSQIDSEETNVEAVAHSIGMSRKSLYRKIKAITGQNINEYIRSVKIKRAAHLISEEGYNISQAAFAVGFSSVKYFRKLFKDQYGKLPSDLTKEKEL